MERLQQIFKEFGLIATVAVIGISLMIYGLWGAIKPTPPTVEIIKGSAGQKEEQVSTVTVDVAGSVVTPGVYTLPSKSRIGDAIVAAGGLSAQADRAWVAQTLNLAQEITDASKIYIPSIQEKSLKIDINQTSATHRINLNTATLAELDSLTGIGEVRAQAIIDQRPYGETHEVVTKAKVPESTYAKIKDQISVY